MKRRAKKRPEELTDSELYRLCERGELYLKRRLTEFRPFLVQLFRRIEKRPIWGIRTKTQACALIGCSLRTAEQIVSGTTNRSAKEKAARETDSIREPGRAPEAPKQKSEESLADELGRYAREKLRLVMVRDWPRFQEILAELKEFCAERAMEECCA